MTLFANPLLADLGDLIGFIIFLVIMGFSLVSKLSGMKEAVKQQPKRPPPAPPRPVPPGRPMQARGAQGGPGPQGSIEREIEAFLRQARGEEAAVPPPPRDQPVRAEPVRVGQSRARPVRAQRVPDQRAIEPGREFGQSIAEHVEEHIGSHGLEDRDAHLGEQVALADERVEQQLGKAFDHDIGQLTHVQEADTSISEGTDANVWQHDKQGAATATVETTPDAIRRLLSTPDDIRNVFIISEILKRPDV